jgi:hypothetical protein
MDTEIELCKMQNSDYEIKKCLLELQGKIDDNTNDFVDILDYAGIGLLIFFVTFIGLGLFDKWFK